MVAAEDVARRTVVEAVGDLAQVAHEILGVPVARTRVVHGDTAMTPYSTGSWGSRVMVMAGGAVAAACRARTMSSAAFTAARRR